MVILSYNLHFFDELTGIGLVSYAKKTNENNLQPKSPVYGRTLSATS
jgi:hypothetical protein